MSAPSARQLLEHVRQDGIAHHNQAHVCRRRPDYLEPPLNV